MTKSVSMLCKTYILFYLKEEIFKYFHTRSLLSKSSIYGGINVNAISIIGILNLGKNDQIRVDQMESCRSHFLKYQILPLTCLYIHESCEFVIKHPQFYSPVKNYKT